jgi:hypothetical protein
MDKQQAVSKTNAGKAKKNLYLLQQAAWKHAMVFAA